MNTWILLVVFILGAILAIYGEIAGDAPKDGPILSHPLRMTFPDAAKQVAYRICWGILGLAAFICLMWQGIDVFRISWAWSAVGAFLGTGVLYILTIAMAYTIFAIGFMGVCLWRYSQRLMLWWYKIINK